MRLNIRPFLAQDIPGGKKGAGILRTKPNIKWEKDRGKEPLRDKKDFPWFWGWDEEKQDFAGAGEELFNLDRTLLSSLIGQNDFSGCAINLSTAPSDALAPAGLGWRALK